MNDINSFTFYRDYYFLIDTMPIDEKRDLAIAILDYIFKDIRPDFEGHKKAVFNTLSHQLDVSKNKSKSAKKENQMKIKQKSNENQMKIKRGNKTSISNFKFNISNLEFIKEIINYLNNKTNSNFKYTTKTTQQKINARLNEGYKLNDFIAVIDKKYNEWVGTEFEQYLVPETLFGTKFEKYLNQKGNRKNEPIPNWFDKEVEVQEATKEEQEEMENLLKEFK